MKIVLWIGNEANQKALANKIHAQFPITAIITETRKHKTKITLRKIVEKLIEKIFLPSIAKSWWGMKSFYENNYPSYPSSQILDVENINSDAAYNLTKEINPDLIIVSGTRMVREKMLSIQPHIGILNLHTGLSPYIRGGPNCTNWCLATQQFHLIGNTIMWIDAGIDTGNLLTTEFTGFDGKENLSDIHFKVMEHAHALYIKAIQYLSTGHTKSIKQSSIASGKTFYTREWGIKEKMKLVRHVKMFQTGETSGQTNGKRTSIKTVSL